MNKLVKTVPKDNLYFEFLKSLNGILKLTDRELDLMTELVKLDVNFEPASGLAKNVASAANRKLLKSILGITPDNLSRYITKFKRDGLLICGSAEDELFVNKILIPEVIKDRVQITIILKINNAETKEDLDLHDTSK